MMDFLSQLFGGTNDTTTRTSLSPQMQSLVDTLMSKAGGVLNKPYQKYPGERVAAPTASRGQVTPWMAGVGQQIQNGVNDKNGYMSTIASMINRPAGRVTAPAMVNGGAQANYAAPPAPTPVPTTVAPISMMGQ